MAKINITLLHVSLVLALAASSTANTSGPHRRDHADLGRLVKKRSPIGILGSQPSAPTPSTSPAAQPTQDTSATAQTTPANSVSVPTTSEPASASVSASPSTTSGDGLLGTIGGLLPTGSGTTSSSVSTTSLSSSYSSNTPQTSAQASKQPVVTPAQSATQSVVYLTSNAPTPTQSSSTSSSSSGMSHAAMTVLIVIAASVGAAVIVWTIIRKWKFRPSSDFEGRMQPIDWQPGGSNEDTSLPNQRRLSRASSFHSGSGSGHADDQMRGPVGGYSASVLNPIPDHDFTAGAAHLAPVGGYADLARGLSPQPMMQESLRRAPSTNGPIQYDPYGVPLHHGYNGY